MNLPAAHTALLVIDVQRALFDPPPFEADEVIVRINALAARARAAGVPVVFVQHENDAGLACGSTGWELEPHLVAGQGDLRVRKRTPDSFLRTDLHERLTERGVRHLLVCGYASEFCIDTSVRSAAAKGYAVTLAADAHTTHDKPHGTAQWIRTHHTETLCDVASFGVPIDAAPAAEIAFTA
jgi:nicotinamidase-related amidase